MNVQEAVNLVENLIERHRISIGERPKMTPVTWKGIGMTVEEAKLAIREFESVKLKLQSAMNGVHTGGEITTVVTGSTGLVAMVTGVALMCFPPTAIAGVATLVSGVGLAGAGKAVGDGIKNVGTNSNEQRIRQIDAYIDSIKNAIIASI